MRKFYVAALTGRSGSGKSYASGYLRAKGIPVIDGDAVAREVVRTGSGTLKELVRAFGSGILKDNGSLNRRALADMCFADEKKKKKLNSITHPAIIEKLTEDFERLSSEGHRYCLVEAAALVESGLYAVCDRTIMITSNEKLEIARIVSRDGITAAQAKTRLDAQLRPDEVRALCDVELTNDGDLSQFDKKLDVLAEQLNEWFLD
ncbi:MAG: dephospho-CoA kinase [Oscillospiraceae bacterium]